MKKTYLKPVTTEERLNLAQIIASSPFEGDTPQIGGESEGGDGLVKDGQWGDLW